MWALMVICYIGMFFSILLLSITGLQSYYEFMIFQAGDQEFSLITIVFYMFSETLIMFYFIGSGTAIKKEVKNARHLTSCYDKVKKTKMILFPHLTLNMILIGIAFILIGAVDTGSVPASLQSVVFTIGFIHFLYTVRLQHLGFKENVDIVIELANVSELN